MRLQKQTLALAVIGIIDLATTLYFVRHRDAAEANPMMAAFLSQGLAAFLIAKMSFIAGPLAVLEWARKYNPIFVTRALNVGVAAYIVLYSFGIARVNAQPDWNNLEAYTDQREWLPLQRKLMARRHGTPVSAYVKVPNQTAAKTVPMVTAF